MTMRRAGRRSFRGSSPRRKVVWDKASIGVVSVAATVLSATELTAGFRVGTRKGLTVLRCIGELYVRIAAAASDKDVSWQAGIVMMSNEASAAGAFPDPVTDGDVPWLWYKRGVETNGPDITGFYGRYEIDVKSKRAFRADDGELWFIMENGDVTEGIVFSFGIRTLYALP